MSELPHIVVVDDDRAAAALLGGYLQQNGYDTSLAVDGASLDRVLALHRVDLVVLDVVLRGAEDGLSICRRLQAQTRLPVIMLTARGSELDRVLGLELGADDYVVKPFSPRELLARIRNVLRRRQFAAGVPGAARLYRFGGWTLDAIARRLVDPEGQDMDLSGSEFALLLALVSHGNQVLSRNRLIELTKGREAAAFDRSIDVCISRLRQMLCDHGRASRIIKTVYGEGYVLGVPVELEG
jgi:two-component system OmpR family response regulator